MRKNRIFILIAVLLVLMSVVVYAAPETEVVITSEQKVLNLEYKEGKSEDTSNVGKEGLYSGDVLLYEKDSVEMQTLLNNIKISAKEDAVKGLSKIVETIPTRDNVELSQWGLFLSKYTDKEITEFPVGDITFTLGMETFNIKASKSAKTWIKETVLPVIYEGIVSENLNYPAAMYKLNIEPGHKLKDLSVDITNKQSAVELYRVYPFTGNSKNEPENYIIYNTGTYYGLALDKDYVEVLRGYHNESKYLVSVPADVPACVNVLAYITLPKNLSDLTMTDKSLQDMSIYNGLAVNLLNKELIDTYNLSTDAVTLLYKDYSIKEEELILVPLTDSIVVVQPVFVEYFNKWGKDLNTAHYIDFTDFFMGKGDEVRLTDMSNGNSFYEPITNYVGESGLVSVKLGGRYTFGLYVRNDKLPYDRILKRLYGPEGASVVKEKELKVITDSIEKDLKAQGRSADFKAYMKAARVSTFPVIVIPVFIVFAVVIVLVIKTTKSSKKRKNVEDNSDLLFNPDEDVVDDSDIDEEDR